MSKFIKKILNFQKRKNGNISILVLVMSLAIILLTTAMVGYIFHDIGFTELDKEKLRALHFAESGLSNMYYKIEQYGESGVALPPVSPAYYTEPVGDPADPEGSFTVEYETYYLGEYSLIERYDITSTGTDISSSVARTVRVNVLTLNIYDFIFSGNILCGNTTIVGPFLVNGELDIVTGRSKFLEGPLFVKENIIVGGSSSIGEVSNSIDLFMGGSMFDLNGSKIDPLNPPDSVGVYVDKFYNSVFNIYLPDIDDNYINSVIASGAKVIEGNLFIGNGIIKVNEKEIVGGYDNYLKFVGGVLQIGKNTVVRGNITIGATKGTKYAVKYKGKANLISTGNIYVYSQLIPVSFINFPVDDLLGLVAKNNIYLHLNGALGGTINNPNAAVMAITNNMIELKNGVIIRGCTISDNLTMAQNSVIYYEKWIGNYLPAGVPEFNDILFSLNWQEIIAD